MSTTTVADADVVVLDAHGVVFDRAFPTFVRRRAVERGEDPIDVWARWRDRHRLDFWEGRTTPAEMWTGLFPGDCPARLTADLERTYRPGPLFGYVATGSHRLWLLSNHRSGWLLPRLQRFGIADRFERVLVSDHQGIAKPNPAAFEPLRTVADQLAVCVLDDSLANVRAARSVGLVAHHLDHDGVRRVVPPVEPREHPSSDPPSRRRT